MPVLTRAAKSIYRRLARARGGENVLHGFRHLLEERDLGSNPD
jgi:hypothetical protein